MLAAVGAVVAEAIKAGYGARELTAIADLLRGGRRSSPSRQNPDYACRCASWST
jgi:hypothetical protein